MGGSMGRAQEKYSPSGEVRQSAGSNIAPYSGVATRSYGAERNSQGVAKQFNNQITRRFEGCFGCSVQEVALIVLYVLIPKKFQHRLREWHRSRILRKQKELTLDYFIQEQEQAYELLTKNIKGLLEYSGRNHTRTKH